MIGTAVKVNTKQTAKPYNLTAPIGGLNGRDPRAEMAAQDAYQMDNMLPGTASCKSRGGCAKWSSNALAGPVQTLSTYSSGTQEKMLAFAGGNIYDVSLAAPVSLKTGQVANTVNTTMFSNAADGAQHLIIVTGSDDPVRYDGTSITTLAMTNLQPNTTQKQLNIAFSYKGRLYFGQVGKLGFYYLPPGQLQGSLTYFDLAQVSSLGGRLVAIASYSDDAGKTPNDYLVFVTSKGEIIVYSGYDPSSTANWTLVGRYYASPPVGPNCLINYGSDIILITTDGAITFSEIRKNGSAQANTVTGEQYSAITSKLGSYFSDLIQYASGNPFQWMGCQYAGSTGWLLLNCPAQSALAGTYYQFVMNTTTNAWCRLTGWNGLTFVVFKGTLYFGRFDGYVMQADTGKIDDGTAIQIDVRQAYNYFDDGQGAGPVQKHFLWGSALLESDGTAPVSMSINVDFQEGSLQNPTTVFTPIGGAWDTSPWDVTAWVTGSQPQRVQSTFNREGTAGSLYFKSLLTGQSLIWYSTQVILELTGGLLI